MDTEIKISKSNFAPAFSLVEVLLPVALFALLVSGLTGGIIYLQQNSIVAGRQGRALMLAEEGLEAARGIRDSGFANLSDGSFGLAEQNGAWALSPEPDQTDIFSRDITIADVSPTVKQVVSTVTWQQDAERTGSISLVTRLTDFRGN